MNGNKSEIFLNFFYKPLTLLEIYPYLEAVSNIKEMQSSQPVTFSVRDALKKQKYGTLSTKDGRGSKPDHKIFKMFKWDIEG